MDAARHPVIYWKVAAASPRIASFRYRVALPGLHLERLGYRSQVLTLGTRPVFDAPSVLVLAKSFSPDDVETARLARAAGVPIVLDLCDNIFVSKYESLIADRHVFQHLAQQASALVVTGTALADAAARHCRHLPQTFVIADAAETEEDTSVILQRYRGALIREFVHWLSWLIAYKLRDQGIGWIPGAVVRNAKRLTTTANAFVTRQRAAKIVLRSEGSADSPSFKSVAREHRIAWFGNHGGMHAQFGMRDILLVASALERLNRRLPIRLVVVSNNRGMYEREVQGLPFPTEYREWSPRTVSRDLRTCAAAILPNSLDEFSICKSANRLVTAVLHGLPVVATPTPALEPFRGCVAFNDWEEGLYRYLTDRQRARFDVETAGRLVAAQFSGEAIATRWEGVLRYVLDAQPAVTGPVTR